MIQAESLGSTSEVAPSAVQSDFKWLSTVPFFALTLHLDAGTAFSLKKAGEGIV